MVQWESEHAAQSRPIGFNLDFNGWLDEAGYPAAYTVTPTEPTLQTRDESGADWWYSHCNLDDGGFVAVGYANYVNWAPDMGCGSTAHQKNFNVLQWPRMERPDRRMSNTRQAVARYDQNGELLWFKTFASGLFYDVIQDHAGHIVATGSSEDLKPSADVQPHNIYFNPTAASPTTSLSALQCNSGRQRQASVMKLDLNGNIQWDHLYNFESGSGPALERRSEGHGIIETYINGTYGYRIIGQNAIDPGAGAYLLELDLDQDGRINWKERHERVPGLPAGNAQQTVAWTIGRTPVGTGEYYAVAGFRVHEGNRSAAFLWVRLNDNTLFLKDTKESTDVVFAGHHSPTYDQNSDGVCFLMHNGAPSAVVWPVLADYTTNGTARGYTSVANHQAIGLVYKFDLDGNADQEWGDPVDLGVMRGFDLHLAITPTADGNVALASTKWSPGFNAQSPFGWSGLSAPVQAYLNEIPPNGDNVDLNGPYNTTAGGFFRWDEPAGPAWYDRDPVTGQWGNLLAGPYNFNNSNGNISTHCPYGYWNTDSYVAKLQGTTGSMLWDHQWDEGTGEFATGWPGNFRRRQCNFRITETTDGGLVVCGNTGHNFDDAYLAKVWSPCSAILIEPQFTYACPDDPYNPPGANSISLTVSGGSGNHAYLWSNGATTADISGLAPGSYTVQVMDLDDQCTATASFDIPEPMQPHLLGLRTDCMSGADPVNPYTTFSVSVQHGIGPFSYIWYHMPDWPLGTPVIVWVGPTFVESPSHYATYVIAIDEGTGCSRLIFTSEAVELVTAQSISPAACTSGGLGSINLTIDPVLEPYTFLWSNGATEQNASGLEAGAYTLEIGYGDGCTDTFSFIVPDAAPCCTADITIPNGAHSSDYAAPVNTYFNNTSLRVKGTFHVDNNCLVNFSTMYMDPGAEIIVEPGAMFVLRDSEVENCTDMMWKSLTARSGAYLEMQRNTVKDAEYAITALDGATVILFNNDITDNRVGLYVPNTPGVAFNSVSAHVIGNRFKSTGTLAQAYPGQTTTLGNVGFAAVLAYRTALDLTGHPSYGNTVDGMSNGILAFNSDLSVARFDLKNVQPDGAYSVPNDANGSGIHVYGRNGAHYLRQTGNGKQGPPSFQNCRRGIHTLGMNTISRDNNMQGVGTAYRVDKARNTTEITNNRVNTKLSGMEFNQNAGTLRFWVIGNDITFGTLAEPIPAPLCSGILVADGNSGGQDSRIEGNTISMLSHPLAKTGINLLAARKWTVAGNSIVMGNSSYNRYGIANYGSSRLEVSCNTVEGPGSVYPQGAAALYSNLGDRLLFSCNDLNFTTNGMLFNGVAYDVDVRGNSIRRHKIGMHLSGNAIIGSQERKGNLWYNPPAQGGLGAWYEPIIQGQDNPNASLNPFTYNPAIINGGSTEPTSWAPYPWFVPSNLPNYECLNQDGSNYCSQFHVAKLGGSITELDGLVAKDSLRNDPYTEESKWMLKDGLYKKLDDDPDLRVERPDMANFYAAMQGTATAAFKAIDDGRPALYNMDSTVVAQLQANNDEITALMDSVKLRMALLEDNNLSEGQRAALLADMLGFREGIRTLATWNTTAMQVATDSKVLTAEGLKVANSIIGVTELTETNRKVVDGIYLSTIGKDIDTFTVAQSNDLFTIANQCPMLGGNAVYTARALYRLIDETYAFDDQLLCLPHGILVKRLVATEPNGLAVVPNPTRDQAVLVLGKPLNRPGTLLLFNAMGQEILREAIPSELTHLEFSTVRLAPGPYQYRVEAGDALLGYGKLTIVR